MTSQTSSDAVHNLSTSFHPVPDWSPTLFQPIQRFFHWKIWDRGKNLPRDVYIYSRALIWFFPPQCTDHPSIPLECQLEIRPKPLAWTLCHFFSHYRVLPLAVEETHQSLHRSRPGWTCPRLLLVDSFWAAFWYAAERKPKGEMNVGITIAYRGKLCKIA